MAAAHDQGSRVDMEGTATLNNSCANMLCQNYSKTGLKQHVDTCRHTCDQAGCTARQEQFVQVLMSAVLRALYWKIFCNGVAAMQSHLGCCL